MPGSEERQEQEDTSYEQAAMKCLYLVVRSLDATGSGLQRLINRWKPTLIAFAIIFERRRF
jgi:hypothetical protein